MERDFALKKKNSEQLITIGNINGVIIACKPMAHLTRKEKWKQAEKIANDFDTCRAHMLEACK